MIVILDNLRSIHNCASIFRTADGAGVVQIFLCGTTPKPIDKWGRDLASFSKVSLGAEKSVRWRYFDNIEQAIKTARKMGYKMVALEQDSKSISIYEYTSEQKIALLLGPEVTGISRSTLDLCDTIVEIPMRGQKESLNVSVAFGIATYILTQNYVN
jgi:tRNA G18 (ribose-2'-O)-methylase SpoU